MNMKKIYLILASFAAIAAVTGCSKKFIEEDKPYSMNESTVFSSPEYIEADLLGCYSIFKSSNPTFMGGLGSIVFDSRGEDIVNVSNPVTMMDTYCMTVLGTTLENSRIWTYAYGTINNCNLFADKLDKYECQKVLGEELYKQFKAEARFIRAYCYYVLCQLYSQPYCINPDAPAVPLRLKGLESSGNNDCPLSTIKQVYEQILADCTPDDLPDAPGTYDGASRASAAAAHLLRMRVYMAQQEWDKAITEGKAITGYELADDVSSIYGSGNVYESKEVIFALPSSTKDNPNTQMSCAEYFCKKASVCWIDTDCGIFAYADYNNAKDQRVCKLVSEPDDNGFVYSMKYTDFGQKLDWVILMRYAEVKLNLAECYANTTSGTVNAKAELKDVRRRSIAQEDDTIDIDAISTDIKTAVYNERRIEFICEGIRGIDIIRRGETFSKSNSFIASPINVTPESNGYTWPIPDIEYTYNKAISK